MAERTTERSGETFGPAPGTMDDMFSNDTPDPVTVSHGPYSEQLPVGGMTVEAIRTRFRDRFDIDPASIAIVDGNEVSDSTTVQPGQMLTFVRRAGEKGRTAPARGGR